MKALYQNPMLQVIAFESSDVITTSTGNQLPDEESPFWGETVELFNISEFKEKHMKNRKSR